MVNDVGMAIGGIVDIIVGLLRLQTPFGFSFGTMFGFVFVVFLVGKILVSRFIGGGD